MADLNYYRPRRSTSRLPWRRWAVTAVALIVVVWIGQAVFGQGGTKSAKNAANDNRDTGIALLNDTAVANANTGDLLNANGNTNTAPATSSADWTSFSTEKCTAVIGAVGEAKNVALTFDLSAANDQAKQVVQLLQQKKTPADFFSTGTFAEAHTDFVKSVTQAGFAVYNHGQKSVDMTALSSEAIASSLQSAEASITQATAESSKPLFRPPFGNTSAALVTAARTAGYCTVTWTVDAFDWQEAITANQAKQRVLDKLRPGAIILLHAGYDVTPQFLPSLVTAIHDQGYTPVTLATLMQSL